jgi:[acyl-carrier-protein] S-malonyltransferase
MAADLIECSAAARRVFARAQEVSGLPIGRLCADGPEEELRRTDVAQPALVAAELAALAALGERLGLDGEDLAGAAEALGVRWVAGHSLGEYAACVVAGALSIDDGLRLAAERGRLMAEARAGAMAAVLGLDAERLDEICRASGDVDVANDNAPGQVVISGTPEAVARASAAAKDAGARRVVPLNVAGAFHSRLMADAASHFAERLDAAEVRQPRLTIVGNVTAGPLASVDEVRDELRAQIARPVRWRESVIWLRAAGAERAVECGPGDVLAGLVRRTAPDLPVRPLATMADVETLVG